MSKIKYVLSAALAWGAACSSIHSNLHSAERPTLNHTCDPRPDILPHPFYYAHTEYRRAYNRPRDITGWLVHKIEPSSLEAMVWCENVQAGNYDQKHMPPMYKSYCYPKPWEALLTGARPDFPRADDSASERSKAASGDSEQTPAKEEPAGEKPADQKPADDKPTGTAPKEMSDSESNRVPPVPVPPAAVRYLPTFNYTGR